MSLNIARGAHLQLATTPPSPSERKRLASHLDHHHFVFLGEDTTFSNCDGESVVTESLRATDKSPLPSSHSPLFPRFDIDKLHTGEDEEGEEDTLEDLDLSSEASSETDEDGEEQENVLSSNDHNFFFDNKTIPMSIQEGDDGEGKPDDGCRSITFAKEILPKPCVPKKQASDNQAFMTVLKLSLAVLAFSVAMLLWMYLDCVHQNSQETGSTSLLSNLLPSGGRNNDENVTSMISLPSLPMPLSPARWWIEFTTMTSAAMTFDVFQQLHSNFTQKNDHYQSEEQSRDKHDVLQVIQASPIKRFRNSFSRWRQRRSLQK